MLLYIIVIIIFITVLLTISSRIRKVASRAFEREEIAGEDFFLIKPEGLINPIRGESKFAFEAYSKEFGKGDDAEEFKQAQIFVNVFSEAEFSEICEKTKQAAGSILSEEISGNVCLIKAEETLKNVAAYNFYKIIEGDSSHKIYVLKITVLKEFLEEYRERVDETLESFRLK